MARLPARTIRAAMVGRSASKVNESIWCGPMPGGAALGVTPSLKIGPVGMRGFGETGPDPVCGPGPMQVFGPVVAWTCIGKDTAGESFGAFEAGWAFRLQGAEHRNPGEFHVAPPDLVW